MAFPLPPQCRPLRIVLAALACFVAAYVGAPPVAQADSPTAQRSLVLGLVPHMAATEMSKRFSPLAAYLSQSLGASVSLKLYKTFDDMLASIGRSEVDIAYLGPGPYLQATARHGHMPILAQTEIGGNASFRGVVFVREDSPYTQLSDLESARITSISRFSTMDFLIKSMLADAGVAVDQLSVSPPLGSHPNAALGVLVGDFDAGCIKEDIFKRYAKRGLRKLANTPPIPEHVFAAHKSLPPHTAETVRDILTNLHNSAEGRAVMAHITPKMTAMTPANASAFDHLRAIVDTLATGGRS